MFCLSCRTTLPAVSRYPSLTPDDILRRTTETLERTREAFQVTVSIPDLQMAVECAIELLEKMKVRLFVRTTQSVV